MKFNGVRAHLLLVLAISTIALVLASIGALWSIQEIRQEVSQITEQEVPKTTTALTIARIGERLQRSGESFVASPNRKDRQAIEATINKDIQSMRRELQHLRTLLPASDQQETHISALSENLTHELTGLRYLLDLDTEFQSEISAIQHELLARQEQILQTIGPSILAVTAILQGDTSANTPVIETAINSIEPLFSTERLLNLAITQSLLAERAPTQQETEVLKQYYIRSIRQLDGAIASLPAGLKASVTTQMPYFEKQTEEQGLFALRQQELVNEQQISNSIGRTRDTSEDLNKAVNQLLTADRESLGAMTERLADSFLSQTLQFIIGTILILLLMTVLSYRFIVRPISVNLGAVTQAMSKLAAGERDTPVPGIDRSDEIGDLARAFTVFKDMVFRMDVLDKELAEKSRLLVTTFDSMNDGFTVHDATGRFLAWNPRYLSLYDLPEDAVYQSMPILEIHGKLAQMGVSVFSEQHEEVGLKALSTSRKDIPQRFELAFPSGRIVELRSHPIPDGGYVSIHMDITEKRAQEAQLLQAQKMETVGLLSGGIAHDFNNILAVIVGNLNILRRSIQDNPVLQERISKALGAANRATSQVERLLAFSRRQPLSPEYLDVNALINSMTDLLDMSVGRSVKIELELENGLPEIFVDPGQLENAVMNLVINARDALEDIGYGTISIRTSLYAGNRVELVVADTGHGIPADKLDAVFDPFYTTKPKGKGSGLGLSMVYGFVTDSDGTVEIESKPGEGTRVIMRFAVSAENEARIQTPGMLPLGAGEKLLVVDDDTDLLELTADQLQQMGYKVTTATDGSKALEILETGKFDLLYTDVMMPEPIDGIELANKAKLIDPEIVILLTTAEAAALKDLSYPALQKPVDETKLANTVHELLALRRSQHPH